MRFNVILRFIHFSSNHRDKNFNGVGPVLSREAKVISSQFDERHGDKSVQEIKQFVAQLPRMLATKQSLAKRKSSQLHLATLLTPLVIICRIYHRYMQSVRFS